MKRNLMGLLTIAIFIALSPSSLIAQNFEGTIEFKKITSIDTVDYVYYIKGDQVRIDEIASDKRTAGTMLVNIKDGSAKSLSPERKLYIDVEPAKASQKIAGENLTVEKGKNVRTIAGYKCTEIIVKNVEQNTVVTYFIAKDNFHFLDGVIKALNRKDKISSYYQGVKEVENSFPFLAIEADFTGAKRTTMEVVSVNKTKLDGGLFQVPNGYKKFER